MAQSNTTTLPSALMAGTAVVERVGHPQSVDIDERKKRKPARQIDWAALEKEFGELALQEPPLSLTDIAARIGLDLRQVGKRWPDLAKQVSARYRALSDETWRNRMEQRFAAADRAAQLLMEAGLPATPKNMKEVLADEFCFAGSRLWTTWRERHLSGAPLVEPTT